MELLALIAGITACVFLVQSLKAKGLIRQLRMELASRQNDLKSADEEVVSLRQQLDRELKELERFKDILDAEAEAARILGETRSERNRLLQRAQAKVDEAESRLRQATADAEAQKTQILGKTKLERDQLLQQAQSKVNHAEDRLQQAVADAAKIIADA